MNLKQAIRCTAAIFGCLSVALAAPPTQPETFHVATQTKVPGLTLKPGNYTIRVVDRLSDRVIVRIDGANGGDHTTFIGLNNSSIAKPTSPGIVPWTGSDDNASYVRGWYFPSSASVVEFVYPKAEAVKIAQQTDSKVPAIDPASEGRVADKDLSKDDMELVTLWLLSSTEVSGSGAAPAIKAERYKQVASVRPPRPAISALPHTASQQPVVWMVGGMALLGALGLGRIRRATAGGA